VKHSFTLNQKLSCVLYAYRVISECANILAVCTVIRHISGARYIMRPVGVMLVTLQTCGFDSLCCRNM